ncbi:MAG: hypothetical protein PVG14_07150 [Anaerolineales bacterium]
MPMRLNRLFISLLLFVAIVPGVRTRSAVRDSSALHRSWFPLVSNSVNPSAAWIGPGGGVIPDLIFDPNNPDIVFAAAWKAGIYKSSDGGQTWRNVSIGLDDLEVTVLEVSPKNSLILYAGTYQGNIYKSVDNGETWHPSGEGLQDEAVPYAIEVDPTRSKRVFVATRGIASREQPPWNGIVYKSNNGGVNWLPVLENVGGVQQEDWAYDLAIHPTSSWVIYAATHEHGAYRSQNFGEAWVAINEGITDLTGRAIEPHPLSPYPGKVFYAPFHRTGVFISKDGGEVWNLSNKNISEARIYRITLDPLNPDNIYLATFDHGVMKSNDGGVSWSCAGLNKETILDVVVQPDHPKRLLSGTLENGLFRSTDGGSAWEHSQRGLNASTVTSLVVQEGDSQSLYASLFPGWLARSTDGGVTWSDYHNGLEDKYIHSLVPHPDKSNLLYALTDRSGLYRRDTQNGTEWKPIGENIPTALFKTSETAGYPFYKVDLIESLFPGQDFSLETNSLDGSPVPLLTMDFSASNHSIAYLGTSAAGVYRSEDQGITWSPAGLSGLTVYDLAVHPEDSQRVYAAIQAEKSMRLSVNGGVSWMDMKLPDGTAYALSIPLSDPDSLLAATDHGIYKYQDENWVQVGLSASIVNAIAHHPIYTNVVYAGTTEGAFLSTDAGLTWQDGPVELQGISIGSISFDPNDPHIVFFATSAHGVLRAEY